MVDSLKIEQKFCMSLATVDGTEIGHVKIFLSIESATSTEMQEHWLGQPLEVVELSKGYRSRKSGGVEYYYNVMWIEWETGFACRKGLGRASMQEWDMLELDYVDLTLG